MLIDRGLGVAVIVLMAGCATVVLPPVSDNLKQRATTEDFPRLMTEYAASGFYLRQRLQPVTRPGILPQGVSLIAKAYGGRSYDYEPSDAIVRKGLFDAFELFCARKAGRVESRGELPSDVGTFTITERNGRACVANNGKMLGAIVYGNASRRDTNTSWRSLEYDVLGAMHIEFLHASAEGRRKFYEERQQQIAAEGALVSEAMRRREQKMKSLHDPQTQKAYAAWRQQVKAGDYCWVGPRQLHVQAMLHGMVIDRKEAIVRVQYDGNTNTGMKVDLPSREEWVNLNSIYPEHEFEVISGSGVFTPRTWPQ